MDTGGETSQFLLQGNILVDENERKRSLTAVEKTILPGTELQYQIFSKDNAINVTANLANLCLHGQDVQKTVRVDDLQMNKGLSNCASYLYALNSYLGRLLNNETFYVSGVFADIDLSNSSIPLGLKEWGTIHFIPESNQIFDQVSFNSACDSFEVTKERFGKIYTATNDIGSVDFAIYEIAKLLVTESLAIANSIEPNWVIDEKIAKAQCIPEVYRGCNLTFYKLQKNLSLICALLDRNRTFEVLHEVFDHMKLTLHFSDILPSISNLQKLLSEQ